ISDTTSSDISSSFFHFVIMKQCFDIDIVEYDFQIFLKIRVFLEEKITEEKHLPLIQLMSLVFQEEQSKNSTHKRGLNNTSQEERFPT
ncbi:9975_t:CDS:2, partial [Funneliformis mosseae]